MQKDDIKQNLKNTSSWIRILYMLLFAALFFAAKMIFWLAVVFQLILSLLTGEVNSRLLGFSRQIVRFLFDIMLYLTYNTEHKPFPFADWSDAAEETEIKDNEPVPSEKEKKDLPDAGKNSNDQ